MLSDAIRIDAYNAGTAPTTVGLKIAAQLSTMKLSFTGATNDLVSKQLLTAAVLDAATIVGPMRGRYHAFSNRLFKISRNYNGLAATQMAQIEHDKWESVCQTAVLVSIALQVYNLVVA
jgi:hypothetical protein